MSAPDAIDRTRAVLRQEAATTAARTVMSDGQRRLVFAMIAAGLAWLLVALLVPPRGIGFWLWFTLLPPALAGVAALLGGARGRRVDAWLLGGSPRAVAATPAAALAAAERTMLATALVPLLLAELARASAGMSAAEKAAAGRLIDAAAARWNAAADEAARAALAAALPALVAGLVAGGPDAVRAAERFAADGAR